jgi:hypothetical protein
MEQNYFARVLDTLLTIPGMNDNVKLEIKIPRRNALVLCKLIEAGLDDEAGKEVAKVLQVIPTAMTDQLREIAPELLKKAGLTELNEKLKNL